MMRGFRISGYPRPGGGGARKYRNVPTEHDSPLVGRIKMPSKRQAQRAAELDTLWRAGEVRWWLPEMPIPIDAQYETKRAVMRVDFLILWADGRLTWEDAKGANPTKDWLLKKALVQRRFGIEIETV